MKILFAFLLCACGIAITLAAPQYVDPYATSLPQFTQLSTTPYTGYGQNIRIWPWVIGQYAYPYYQYYSTYWNNLNNNPSSYPYSNNGYNGYNNYNGYNGYNSYNPYNTYNKYNSNSYNPYNTYNRNTGTNTYWNGYAWVNSFRSTQAGKK